MTTPCKFDAHKTILAITVCGKRHTDRMLTSVTDQCYMQACWDEDFKARPSFADVCNRLQVMIQDAAAHHTPKVGYVYLFDHLLMLS